MMEGDSRGSPMARPIIACWRLISKQRVGWRTAREDGTIPYDQLVDVLASM